jgi:hypothetical protein
VLAVGPGRFIGRPDVEIRIGKDPYQHPFFPMKDLWLEWCCIGRNKRGGSHTGNRTHQVHHS